MKRINYLIVAMLMAFTMVGCQFDPTYLENKISGLEESDGKQNERLGKLESRVEEIEGKLKDIDFSKFLKEGEGYVKVDDTEVLNSIKEAVGAALRDDLDGYTKEEIDAKLKAITDITNKLEETYATLEKLNELSTKVTSLETTVTTLSGKVTALENKPAPSGNGGDGYCGLSASEVEKIKEILQKYVNGKLEASILNLTNYALTTDLAGYVKTTKLDEYYSKADLDTILDGDTSNNKNFKDDLATIVGRIATVEDLLTVDGVLGKKLTNLEADINNKVATETFNTFKGTYENLSSMIESLNLADYLTFADLGYETKDKVDNVANSLADLTSRVDTLEKILKIEKNESETISKLKVDYIALKSTVETLATSKALTELSEIIETLEKSVADNEAIIKAKLTDDDSDMAKLSVRVDNLENAQATFNSFVETTTSAIANLNTTVNAKVGSDEITTLITNAIANNATLVTMDYLKTHNYITSGSLSGYATTDKVNELETTVNEAKIYIEEINSNYASLVSDRTSFEICPYRYYNDEDLAYFYYPYIKFTYAGGETEYMTLLDTDSDTKFGLKSSNGNLTLKELMTNISWKTHIQFMSETELNETVKSFTD